MNEIMAYTENRENMSMITLSEEQIDELFGDKYKIYVKATVVDGDLKVTKVVKDRDW